MSKNDDELFHPPEGTSCPRTRLVKGSLAAVDSCGCGMLQLHIGALTLRMAPCALEELASTLTQAVAEHARRFPASEAPPSLGLARRQRGEA
jgi:hypothetical protein